MVETIRSKKYEQYIIRKPVVLDAHSTDLLPSEDIQSVVRDKTGLPLVWCDPKTQKGAKSIMETGIVTEDIVLPSGPNQIGVGHKHNYDEIFYFTGFNIENITELGCEVEFWVGEDDDLEKVIFNTSSCMWVPAGLAHQPIIFRNVKKPVKLMVVMLNTDNRYIDPVSQKGRPKFTTTKI